MRPPLQHEIERLKRIYAAARRPFEIVPGATEEQIAQVEAAFGPLDEDLKALWQFSNGSEYAPWFVMHRPNGTSPCDFVTLEDAFEFWRGHMAYEAAVQEPWDADPERDPRIQPDTLEHRSWFPFAEFNGFANLALLDTAPAQGGTRGQIIVLQHDPDTLLLAAPSFLDFFRASNDWIEANGLLD